jgi:hypothetical protein
VDARSDTQVQMQKRSKTRREFAATHELVIVEGQEASGKRCGRWCSGCGLLWSTQDAVVGVVSGRSRGQKPLRDTVSITTAQAAVKATRRHGQQRLMMGVFARWR